MTAKSLLVLNPNSSQTVTDGIDAAMAPLRKFGVPIRCMTLAAGPPGIETQAQADRVVPPLLDFAHSLAHEALGYVIACFGDPGVHALRTETDLPVLGIQEAAVATALSLGHRFGVISILPASISRHMRAFASMGVMDRLAGDRALGLGIAELKDKTATIARLTDIGAQLRDTDGAEVLILGCAGMAGARAALEKSLGLPVIDPCEAAAAMALGRIALAQTHKLQGA